MCESGYSCAWVEAGHLQIALPLRGCARNTAQPTQHCDISPLAHFPATLWKWGFSLHAPMPTLRAEGLGSQGAYPGWHEQAHTFSLRWEGKQIFRAPYPADIRVYRRLPPVHCLTSLRGRRPHQRQVSGATAVLTASWRF
jgi:hypothetical protein